MSTWSAHLGNGDTVRLEIIRSKGATPRTVQARIENATARGFSLVCNEVMCIWYATRKSGAIRHDFEWFSVKKAQAQEGE